MFVGNKFTINFGKCSEINYYYIPGPANGIQNLFLFEICF